MPDPRPAGMVPLVGMYLNVDYRHYLVPPPRMGLPPALRRPLWLIRPRLPFGGAYGRRHLAVGIGLARPGSTPRRSAGTVAAHKHPVQAAVLAVIVIEARFMQRGAIIDDQQVTLLILVRIAKLRLRDLIGQILQKILGFFG